MPAINLTKSKQTYPAKRSKEHRPPHSDLGTVHAILTCIQSEEVIVVDTLAASSEYYNCGRSCESTTRRALSLAVSGIIFADIRALVIRRSVGLLSQQKVARIRVYTSCSVYLAGLLGRIMGKNPHLYVLYMCLYVQNAHLAVFQPIWPEPSQVGASLWLLPSQSVCRSRTTPSSDQY